MQVLINFSVVAFSRSRQPKKNFRINFLHDDDDVGEENKMIFLLIFLL